MKFRIGCTFEKDAAFFTPAMQRVLVDNTRVVVEFEPGKVNKVGLRQVAGVPEMEIEGDGIGRVRLDFAGQRVCFKDGGDTVVVTSVAKS